MIKLSQKDLKDKENFFYSYMGMKKIMLMPSK